MISEIANALQQLENTLREQTGFDKCLVNIAVTPQVFDEVIIKLYQEPTNFTSTFKPSDIFGAKIVGVGIIPKCFNE